MSFGGSFSGHPLLLLLLGAFAGPLLLRRLEFGQFRRTWFWLPALGLAVGAGGGLLGLMPHASALGWTRGVQLAAALLAGLLGLVALNRLARGRDRELIELSATIPGLLFLPWFWRAFVPCSLGSVLDPLAAGAAGGLLLFLSVMLLTGAGEKYSNNRVPGSMEGLPFRLAMLLLWLVLTLGATALLHRGLP